MQIPGPTWTYWIRVLVVGVRDLSFLHVSPMISRYYMYVDRHLGVMGVDDL